MRIGLAVSTVAFGAAVAALAGLALAGLGHPLFGHDESTTAMLGLRVAEHGFPKLHGPRNAYYFPGLPVDEGVDRALDAQRGAPWAPFYLAALVVGPARGVEDFAARTAFMRAPFALAGLLGVLGIGFAVAPGLGASATSRRAFLAGLALLCAGSISLLLHLREVGPVGPTLALVAAVLALWLRRSVFGGVGAAWHTAVLPGLLFALGHTAAPVACALMAAMALDALLRGLFGRGEDRGRRCLGDLLPLALAALALLPSLRFTGVLAAAARDLGFASEEGEPFATLRAALGHLARFELAVPFAVARLGSLLRFGAGTPEVARRAAAAADRLSLFAGLLLLGVASAPVFDEARLVVLSPVLVAAVALDAAALLALAPVTRAAGAALAAVALAVAVVAAERIPELRGRLHEIEHPYRGRLDLTIEWIASRYEDLDSLVVAANCDEGAYVFYLDATVLVGSHGLQIAHDFMLEPHVVVVCNGWPNGRPLRRIVARAFYGQETLPVPSLPENNVPSLSPSGRYGLIHRFESPQAESGGFTLLYYESERPRH